MRFTNLILIAAVCCFSSAFWSLSPVSTAWAQPNSNEQNTEISLSDKLLGKTVKKIDVEGLHKIEKDAVISKLVTKLGQPLSRENVRADIQALFGMGFFDDIEVRGTSPDEKSVDLVYVLHERPVISKLEFEGNEQISTSDLEDVVKVKQWSILDLNKVKDDVDLIQKRYEEKGFYLTKVSFQIKPSGKDQVELVYKISDYEKVVIRKVTFLNNKKFTDDELKAVLQETREGGPLSFVTSSGSFKESAFKQDLQRLTLWYLDHGYVKFRYENPVVTVSDDKKWLYISIYVDEGDQYKMGSIDFGGDLLFPKPELQKEIQLNTGEIFSLSKRNADVLRLTEKYQDLGYAYVNVIPKMIFHDDVRTVDTEYDFEKGNLVHFGEINVIGNTKTHDKVIRRELTIHEGELFSGSKLRVSQENVERLGYFEPGQVVFNKISRKGHPDIMDLEISVKERSTGTVTLGAGYGSIEGFFLTGQVSEINLFGRGQTISLGLTWAAQTIARSLNLSFTDPYAFDSLWSMGFDLYDIIFPIPNKYNTRKLGYDVRFGHPISNYTYAYLTYKLEGLEITDADPSVPQSMINADNGLLSSVVWSLVRDKRNNRFETTGGNYQSASLETAGIGGDKRFLKGILNHRIYQDLFGTGLIFRNETEVGGMFAVGPNELPPSEKFYLGGPNNMRGYELFMLSPTAFDSNNNPYPLGGAYEAFSLFEVEFPLIKDAGLKGVFFYEAGDTWDPAVAGNGIVEANFGLRTDAGFGIRWFSPMGPLRFEWGFPFGRQPWESSPVFQFFIGPPF